MKLTEDQKVGFIALIAIAAVGGMIGFGAATAMAIPALNAARADAEAALIAAKRMSETNKEWQEQAGRALKNAENWRDMFRACRAGEGR